ncbi:MAG: aspartate aminotransferase family protein [Thermoleophilia bacterium]|nr:aspartate aminotransferase family protein [Thermoleophilia bacterium]
MTARIDRDRLATLRAAEDELFVASHPRSRELFERAQAYMFDGVPMNWMTRWSSPFPPYVEAAGGARVTCVDGHEYVDFCLGDTGAMTGHSPEASVAAIREQAGRGITTMLPTEDSLWVAGELRRRFGLRYWQAALTATDANRFAVRLARHVTKRPKILVYNYCYHGSVDETIITINDGVPGPKPGNAGPPVDPSITTKVIEWNDVDALAAALEPRDVACVLAEPAMTNIGIILPDDGYHDALRRLTRETGTLLVMDETHTISAGPGGCTRAWGLEPDMVTLGKPIGSGVPSAVYGFGQAIADLIRAEWDYHAADECGVGGTLAGNALGVAAMRATLGEVLTEQTYAHTIPLAGRWADGVQSVIDEFELPWVVKRLGCRAEYWPRPVAPRNGGEAAAAEDEELDGYLHLFMLNRGILMTPFHNMALMAPQTTVADVDLHTGVLREAARVLVG